MSQQQIKNAQINWQTDDNGTTIPTSANFGDIYFSKTDGLAESRYVFIDGNDLPDRLAALGDYQRFVVGEIGFGTGLNVLALWQLWQTVKPNNHSHLHIITTEKFPLTKADLTQALSGWSELAPLAKKLIDNYPPPLAGCHRLNFFDERLTIDLWLGDATASLSQVIGHAKVDAWLLDGFAPSCNDELWSDALFAQIARLSKTGTTLATFSVASPVKFGLKKHGFTLAKRKGFGKKREMLTAKYDVPSVVSLSNHEGTSAHPSTRSGRTDFLPFFVNHFSQLKFKPLKPTKLIHYKKTGSHFAKPPFSLAFARKKIIAFAHVRPTVKKSATQFHLPTLPKTPQPMQIAIIGAGVAGLSVAYALAVRGHYVTIIDKDTPLSGASGNIRGFLAPKLTSLNRLATNLHAIGYLASCRFYPSLTAQTGIEILQTTGCLDLLSHNRLALDEVQDFPPEFASLLTAEQAKDLTGFDVGQAIFLPHAGLVDTAHFAKAVLSHANITFQQGTLQTVIQHNQHVSVETNQDTQVFDHIVLCMALETCDFMSTLKRFNHSRGQVSWFMVDKSQLEHLPNLPLKYGSYFAKFTEHGKENVMLGASFVRDTLDTTPALADHISNVTEFLDAVPQAKNAVSIEKIDENWQGRASIRSQTVDYLPLVGQVWQDGFEQDSRVWTFSALGSKGYAYAPICSEVLAGLMVGEILPLSEKMVKNLSPNRKVLQR